MLEGKSVYFVCCLVFFVVWVFRVLFCLLFGQGACSFFCCLGGGPGPAQTAKKNHAPAPSERVFCFALWAGGCVYFFAVWAGCVFFFLLFGRGVVIFFFLLFGRGACSFFCCLGGGRVLFFAVWAGGVFLFLLFGRGMGVHSLTGLPGSSSSDPTTKKTKQPKNKKKRFRCFRRLKSAKPKC